MITNAFFVLCYNFKIALKFKNIKELRVVPNIINIAGVQIHLKEPFDLDFIHQYGTVFKVVNYRKNAGNLCFGVENKDGKYFVKFAGAPNANFDSCTTSDAVKWLKEAKQVYQDLAHDCLIKLVRSEEVGGGYVNIFEWTDAECIGYSCPATRQRFLDLPINAKIRAFNDIVAFHAHVAERGYVAIDFYADQMLYDFNNDKIIICDIDFYQKSPYYGDKGMWGSENFVSPEERVPDLRIDEVTMVYTMGATAFSIFTDYDRSYGKWTMGKPLYDVVKKAVSNDRDMRQQSIRQFMHEWQLGS
ncbi:MAG: hypothetical protein FWE11_04350 [Defluviitaleaceae bacterium]|nr:hypothetical protein [Defluviitaleaceae bacterium]